MRRCTLTVATLVLTALAPALLGAGGAASFQVTGAVAQPGAWTAARLTQQFGGDIRTVTYTLKGVKHTAHAVPLLDVLDTARPRLNPRIKHHELQFVVAVRGFDGYTADFTLAELRPDYGHHAVWLALDEDGKPLASEDGPVGLIVPEDTKPARWVHGVTAITVIDEAQGATSGRG